MIHPRKTHPVRVSTFIDSFRRKNRLKYCEKIARNILRKNSQKNRENVSRKNSQKNQGNIRENKFVENVHYNMDDLTVF